MLSQSQLKYLASLKRKKYRQETGCFLVEGLRLCEALLGADLEIDWVLHCPKILDSQRSREALNAFGRNGVNVQEIDRQAVRRIADTQTPQGIFAVVRKAALSFADLLKRQPDILVVADNIAEPGNLGTMIRTAAWFCVDGLLLSSDSVEYTNPKVVRSSAGALFRIPIVSDIVLSESVPYLHGAGYSIVVSVVQNGVPYLNFAWPEKTVLIFGNEANGVSEFVRNFDAVRINIPKSGSGESLNVAAAAAILLADICKDRMASRIRTHGLV